MSSQFSDLPTSVQAATISAALNGTMLSLFLMGICTMVYSGTLYVYLNRKSARQWIVIGTLTVLYLSYVVPNGAQWYLLKWTLVDNGETRQSAFNATFFPLGWVTLIGDIGIFIQSVLADGLLIWRCFHVWDCSFRVISVSLVLLLAEIAVYLSLIILAAGNNLSPSPSEAVTLDNLIGAAAIITLCSTSLATVLIAYRIYRVSRVGNMTSLVTSSKRTFKHVLDILIQSAAVYSLATILYASTVFLPFDINKLAQFFALQYFTPTVFSFIACVSPTVMVARVTLATPESIVISTMGHVSGLRFQRSTDPSATESGTDSIRVVAEDNDLLQPGTEKGV